jgi:hypothetical protein
MRPALRAIGPPFLGALRPIGLWRTLRLQAAEAVLGRIDLDVEGRATFATWRGLARSNGQPAVLGNLRVEVSC